MRSSERRIAILALVLACGSLLWGGRLDGPAGLGRLTAPAIDTTGQTFVVGSAIRPDGSISPSADIFLGGADGSGLRRLTSFAGNGALPSGASAVCLSGDASRVAYTALPSEVGVDVEELHAIDVDSGRDRLLAAESGCPNPFLACTNCFSNCLGTPHFTPDATSVLYSVRGPWPLRVVSLEGGGPSQLPVYNGDLAPAAKRVMSDLGVLVFTSSAISPTLGPPLATDVYVTRLGNRKPRNVTRFLTHASVVARNATISADGTTIVFEANYDPGTDTVAGATQIWTVRTDGSNLRRLTFAAEPSISASLSGDGSLVAFLQRGRVWLASTAGGGLPVPLTAIGGPVPQDVVISDDGSSVVFSVGPTEGERRAIFAVDLDGRNLRAVYDPYGQVGGASKGRR